MPTKTRVLEWWYWKPWHGREHLKPDKRAPANALPIFSQNGRRRLRAEGIPPLVKKFQAKAETCFPKMSVKPSQPHASD